MKTQSMSIKDFLNKAPEPTFFEKAEKHFKKYGMVYKVAGISLVILSTGTLAFADFTGAASAMATVPASSSGIGPAAKSLYMQLVSVGKWIIIFKGGFDTIKNIGNGDFEAAKKNFFAYLLTYLFLLALPYGMDQVEKVVNAASANQ